MNEITQGNKIEKPIIKLPRGWKPKPTPLERANRLAENLLDAVESQVRRATSDEEKIELFFSSKGLLTTLPKLVAMLEGLKPETEEEGMTGEDLKLLKEWLGIHSGEL